MSLCDCSLQTPYALTAIIKMLECAAEDALVPREIVLTWVHVEGQCLGYVAGGQQAGPRGGVLQLPHLVVAGEGAQMWGPDSGHKQGAVVGVQA